jgi:hypothetical protein
MRVGNTVTVSGVFSAVCTEFASPYHMLMTLPIASNIGAAEDLAGTFATQLGAYGSIIGSISDKAHLYFVDGLTSSADYSFTFTYQII